MLINAEIVLHKVAKMTDEERVAFQKANPEEAKKVDELVESLKKQFPNLFWDETK
jgi:hypothetical protein